MTGLSSLEGLNAVTSIQCRLGPLLQTWINLKWTQYLHTLWSVRWNFLSIPKLQRCNCCSLGMGKVISSHTLLDMWSLIHTGIKVNPCNKRDSSDDNLVTSVTFPVQWFPVPLANNHSCRGKSKLLFSDNQQPWLLTKQSVQLITYQPRTDKWDFFPLSLCYGWGVRLQRKCQQAGLALDCYTVWVWQL